MIKQNYLCVDLTTEMVESHIKENEKRSGMLTMDQENEHFIFSEARAPKPHPELQWQLLDRTKHGRMTANTRHVKVEFYIHHEEYRTTAELADMLASEIETMGENLCETSLPLCEPFPKNEASEEGGSASKP